MWVTLHQLFTNTRFSYKQTLTRNTRLKLAKHQANAKKHSEAELLLFENYSLFSSTLSSKNSRRYSDILGVEKIVGDILCTKKQVRLFERGYMNNGNGKYIR